MKPLQWRETRPYARLGTDKTDKKEFCHFCGQAFEGSARRRGLAAPVGPKLSVEVRRRKKSAAT